MKPAEGGEGEMSVTAAVLQVSAAGCRESTAALPAVRLQLVPNLAVTHSCVSPSHTRPAKLSWLGKGGIGTGVSRISSQHDTAFENHCIVTHWAARHAARNASLSHYAMLLN